MNSFRCLAGLAFYESWKKNPETAPNRKASLLQFQLWWKLRPRDIGLSAQGCPGVMVWAGHGAAGKKKGGWEDAPWLLWNHHSPSLTLSQGAEPDGGIETGILASPQGYNLDMEECFLILIWISGLVSPFKKVESNTAFHFPHMVSSFLVPCGSGPQ